MCLTLRKAYRTPYNKSKIRWKMATVYEDGRIWSPFESRKYNQTGWNVSDLAQEEARIERLSKFLETKSFALRLRREMIRNKGFHCLLSRYDAQRMREGHNFRVVLKLEVRGFLASGTFGTNRCETWNEMRILKVYKR